ncbi:LysR family transcriptional regulator [Pseudorhodoferax sp.]|uniref:LysR family transcriptional regulator n=1 Tax=Pseudorhodoferax sp. TaxID=1993553 RepID=UPI002DD6553F|nr:LysR family transcriptional regulator [Pseudorhodoferax sp.]
MARPDLNLLATLDVLLAEGSVAAAARRLRLSPSAMSRALARLRETMGDPLLVRAGRGLVPSPRALELREQVGRIVQEAEAALRPQRRLQPRRLVRSFTLRCSDGFVERFGPALLARIGDQAPGVQLRFVPRLDKDSALLRSGAVDLETGVVGPATGPELRMRALFDDRSVGVVRPGHPLCQGEVTPARFAAERHVLVARRAQDKGPVDEALAVLGLRRKVVATVGGFAAAIGLVRGSDLVTSVPERHTEPLRAGMHSFELPAAIAAAIPSMTVAMFWHPRTEADPAHRWLRALVVDLCAAERP